MTDLSLLPGAPVVQQKTFGQGEEVFTCVQCKQRYAEYIEVENDILANACNFHEFLPNINHSEQSHRKKVAACCGQDAPCKNGPHRPMHHCDYRYAAHEKLLGDIMNGDCLDYYGDVHDDNLDVNNEEIGGIRRVMVARLNRWNINTKPIEDEDILMVFVGIYQGLYHVKFYTSAELDAIAESGQTRIARCPDSQQSYSWAEWIIKDGALIGVHIEAKAISSPDPDAMDVYFSRSPLKLVRAEKLTDGGLTLHDPATAYNLPEDTRVGPVYPVGESRPHRTHTFHPHGQLPLRCAVNKIECRNSISSPTGPWFDTFTSQLLLVNTNKADNLVIVKITCEYRLVGNREWTPVPAERLDIEQTCTLSPYTLHSCDFKITLQVPDDKSPPMALSHVLTGSLTARFQPIRFRFTLVDVEGRSSFRVSEYVTPREEPRRPIHGTDLRMFVDDLDWLYRDPLPVDYELDRPDGGFRISFVTANHNNYRPFCCVQDFNEVAYQAIQSGEYEQHLNTFSHGQGTTFPLASVVSSYALVDENTHRVYAVKIILSNKTSYQICYFPMPLYGKRNGVASKTVPIKPAVEKAVIPEVAPCDLPVYQQDDDFDDIPYEPKPLAGPSASGKCLKLESSTVANLQRLNASLEQMAGSMEQFESIEKSITSMSDSIAALVDKLAS